MEYWPVTHADIHQNESPELAVKVFFAFNILINYRLHPDVVVVASLGVQEGVIDKAFLKD